MIVSFTLSDRVIKFNCDYVTFGIDGLDMYAVTHECVGNKLNENKNFIARYFNFAWHVVDVRTLLYIEENAVVKIDSDNDNVIPSDDVGIKPLGNTQFEIGWTRGYNQGYRVAKAVM